MQISVAAGYAIHGLGYLGARPEGEVVYVNEIAKFFDVSPSYLAKVFQTLGRSGFVLSYRGVKGGYALARRPEDMNLREVPTPCYVCDEEALERNLALLGRVHERTGCSILLALKGFAMFSLFPLIRRYLQGVSASSPYEARLGAEEFGAELMDAYGGEMLAATEGLCCTNRGLRGFTT